MNEGKESSDHEVIPGYKTALFVVSIISIAYLVFTFLF